MNWPDDHTEAHIDSDLIAAYLDRTLSADETAEVEEHLADCAPCRSELTDAARVLRTRSKRRVWLVAAPVTAAAAALILLFVVPSSDVDSPGGVLRNPGGSVDEGSLLTIDAVAPSPGTVTDTDPVLFVWRRFDEDAVYRITVADEAGDVVWTATTADTIISLPAEIGLAPDRPYLWYVDGLRRDIRSATTGVQEFRTPP